MVPLYKPRGRFQGEPIRIKIEYSSPEVVPSKLHLISQPAAIQTNFYCKESEKCKRVFSHLSHFKDHIKICRDSSSQKNIGKQTAYGGETNIVRQLVSLGYLPSEALDFRKTFFCCYDIETLEDKSGIEEMRNVEAVHKLASISISTTTSEGSVFVRHDSSHEAVEEMINLFIDALIEAKEEQDLLLPDYFENCLHQLEEDEENENIPMQQKMKISGYKAKIEKYLMLDVYGYNSGINLSLLISNMGQILDERLAVFRLQNFLPKFFLF